MLGQRKTWAWNVPAPLATEEQKIERIQFGNQDSRLKMERMQFGNQDSRLKMESMQFGNQDSRLNSVNLTKRISEKICEGVINLQLQGDHNLNETPSLRPGFKE